MKKLTFAFWLLAFHPCQAQVLEVAASYQYLLSPQWDYAIQTYNFSRPELSVKQPLLIHGGSAACAYLFPSEKSFSQGVSLSYSFVTSYAENADFENRLNLHLLQLGYLLHFGNSNERRGFYTDLLISASSCMLSRRVNGEAFVSDERRAVAPGIGGDLSLRAGWDFTLGSNSSLSPFVLAGCTPFLYSPDAEAVLNQTSGLTGPDGSTLVKVQLGLALHLGRSRN